MPVSEEKATRKMTIEELEAQRVGDRRPERDTKPDSLFQPGSPSEARLVREDIAGLREEVRGLRSDHTRTTVGLTLAVVAAVIALLALTLLALHLMGSR